MPPQRASLTSIVSSGPIEVLTGEPSATDFLVIELPPSSSSSPPASTPCPRPSRAWPKLGWSSALAGSVRAFAVYGLLMNDDSVEIIGIEIDTTS